MPEILTNNFNQDINKLFIADAKANDDYYMFVSSIGGIEPIDSATSQNEFLEKTLFAKKIRNQDINFMIKYYPWQRGVVYTEYDDKVDLDGLNFYAVVGPNDNDTDDYRVYKCLNNNEGVGSQAPPTFDAANVNQIYETADGYVWKYMYRLTTLQFEAYNALGYIPIYPTAAVNPAEVYGGGISEIQVTNAIVNNGYEEKNGLIKSIPGRVGGASSHGNVKLEIDPKEQDWQATENYYTGQFFYATNPSSSVTNLFEIKAYKLIQGNGLAEITVGEELSNPRRGNVENATQASPVVITSTSHNLVNGQPITFRNVVGMTELIVNEADIDTLAATTFYVQVVNADTFQLKSDALLTTDLDGTGFGGYVSGGTWKGLTDFMVSTATINANIKIFPRVKISGDGDGAVAVPEIDNGCINKIILLNKGTGYNNAIAEVVDPLIDFNPGGTE